MIGNMPQISRLVGTACLLAVVASSSTSVLVSQTNWQKLSPTTNPTARFGHAMSYDVIRNRVVLYGGWDSSGRSLADTWEYDGTTWTKLNPKTSPPGRDGHTMVYDFARLRTLLFGGDLAGTISADTWAWDGTNWTQLKPTTTPPARKSHTLTYVSDRGKVVMFGGNAGSAGYLNDTWEWDGIDWKLITTTRSPSARIAHQAAYDPINQGVLVFSGYRTTNDTWLYDGKNWTQLNPTTQPPARYDSTLTTDELRQRVVMYGHILDMWEWDGRNWLLRKPATMPANRRDQDVVYDPVNQRLVMFGGGTAFPDTWAYKTRAVASYTSFGTGCKGTAGTPQLTAVGLPWAGELLTLRLTNIPKTGFALFLTGFSNTRFGSITLPADLSSKGLTGCFLRVDPQYILTIATANGLGTFVLPIPAGPAVTGLKFYNQFAVVDALANTGMATTTNGGAGVIGVK